MAPSDSPLDETERQEAERQTRTSLMRVFGERKMHPRSDLGQNFLIDLNLLELVVRAAELTSADVALEVGTGTGGMTTFLARQAGHVISVEVDRHVHAIALEKTAGIDNVTLLLTDALKNKNQLHPLVLETIARELAVDPQRRLKLVANLPYHVAAPVISNLIVTGLPWERMVVTIQWEMAERLAAPPGTGDYSALSIWLQAQCRIEILKKLGPQVFWPRPQVDSAIVIIHPHPEAASRIENRPFLHDFLRRVFTLRRKHLRSVLATVYKGHLAKTRGAEILNDMGLGENARAEELPVATLVELANRLFREIGEGVMGQDS